MSTVRLTEFADRLDSTAVPSTIEIRVDPRTVARIQASGDPLCDTIPWWPTILHNGSAVRAFLPLTLQYVKGMSRRSLGQTALSIAPYRQIVR